MPGLDDLEFSDNVLPALDDVVLGPHRTFHMSAELLNRFPDGLVDETLVLASIRWRKFVGRPNTKQLHKGFDVQIYRWKKVRVQMPGGGQVDQPTKEPILLKLRDSNAHSDSHYSVHIVGTMHTGGHRADRPYHAEVKLMPGVEWTSPAKLVTKGQSRTVDPPEQLFVYPGPVRLDPFTVQFMMPELRP